ncbi:MAG TPA: PaaI family thioesterase [Caulobacteraceae bacterium]|nr:PaaI family thioesterase [Caulobacteraceae bacterium]
MDGGDAQNPWKPQPVLSGEWVGWGRYDTDPFENLTGPFYARRDPASGEMVCAFRAERKHMNGGGAMHGGCMVTFADYAIFMIADKELEGVGSVTASLNAEFVDAAQEGEMIEARGQVVRAGGSMVFVRGLVSASGRPILNFSAIIKKIRRK